MNALLSARGLARSFTVGQGMFRPKRTLHAVNGVDLDIHRGEVVAVVGESGCGKSTLARMLLGLLPPSAGAITLEGRDLRSLRRREIARRVQPVFQDPYSSLNPRRRVAAIVALPLEVHAIGTAAERRRAAIEMLERVGLPARFADRYPRELSGGQRQRVAIARALVMRPEIVICDEPTSALDVSVQSQILNLLLELRRELDLTYVFISHNLAVVEHIASRVAVMYLGRVVEMAATARAVRAPGAPLHPCAAPIGADAGAGPRHPRDGPRPRLSGPAEPAAGLPVPPALPRRHPDLPALDAAARADRGRHRRLPRPCPGRKSKSRMSRESAIARAEAYFDSGDLKRDLARRVAMRRSASIGGSPPWNVLRGKGLPASRQRGTRSAR